MDFVHLVLARKRRNNPDDEEICKFKKLLEEERLTKVTYATDDTQTRSLVTGTIDDLFALASAVWKVEGKSPLSDDYSLLELDTRPMTYFDFAEGNEGQNALKSKLQELGLLDEAAMNAWTEWENER